MNKPRLIPFLALALCLIDGAAAAEGAPPPAERAKEIAVKVEKAVVRGVKAAASGVERGAKAAAHGVKVGVNAAARGIETGAKATARAADAVADKVKP